MRAAIRLTRRLTKYHWIAVTMFLIFLVMAGMYLETWLIKKPMGVDDITLRGKSERMDFYLDKLLIEVPEAFATRVGLIHSTSNIRAATPQTQTEFMRWDIVISRASDGPPLPLIQDQPLASWGDFLDDAAAGKCTVVRTQDITSISSREHMAQMHIYAYVVCPLLGEDHQLLGALFLDWRKNYVSSDLKELIPYIPQVKRTANQVARILRES